MRSVVGAERSLLIERGQEVILYQRNNIETRPP